MKKRVSVCLALCILLSLTACGDKVKSSEPINEVKDTQVATPEEQTTVAEEITSEETTDTELDLVKYFSDGTRVDNYCYIDIEYDMDSKYYGSIDEGLDFIHTSLGNGKFNDVSVSDNEYHTTTDKVVKYTDIIAPVYYHNSGHYSNSVAFTDVYKTLIDADKKLFITDTVIVLKELIEAEIVPYEALSDYEEYITIIDKNISITDITVAVQKAGITPAITDSDEFFTYDMINTGEYRWYDGDKTLHLYKMKYIVDDKEISYLELEKSIFDIQNKNQQGIFDFIKDIYLVTTKRLQRSGYIEEAVFKFTDDLIKRYLEDDDLAEKIINEINMKGLDDRRTVLQEVVE